MSTSGNEDLCAEVVSDQLVFAHRHLGKSSSIQFVINSIEVIRTAHSISPTLESIGIHLHVLAHVANNQLKLWKSVQHTCRYDPEQMHAHSIGVA